MKQFSKRQQKLIDGLVVEWGSIGAKRQDLLLKMPPGEEADRLYRKYTLEILAVIGKILNILNEINPPGPSEPDQMMLDKN